MEDAFRVIKRLIEILNALKLPYLIGGSIASSVQGVFRYTNDIDMVVQMTAGDVARFANAVKDEFYVDEEMVSEAVIQQSAFSLLHLTWFIKVDVFVKQATEWADIEWERRRQETIQLEGEPLVLEFPSPEDMILHKLRWFKLGGGVSDRQWNDILGMMTVQADKLDRAYLNRWAVSLQLDSLLLKALADANI